MNRFLLLIVAFASSFSLLAQDYDVDTLNYAGTNSKYINMVIMGDGYALKDSAKFDANAKIISNSFFNKEPWKSYKNYINIYSVRTVSNESGIKHPNTASDCSASGENVPTSNPDNLFGTTFDLYGIHRLIYPSEIGMIAEILSETVPEYDIVVLANNTSFYGGAGGEYASITMHSSAPEIALHEIGHSFGLLSDEYYAGDMYAGEAINMTQNTNTSTVKWKNWVGSSGIGIYQHCCGGQSANWNKPANGNCEMEALGQNFCAVCMQQLVERIHSRINPIVSYQPATALVTSSQNLITLSLKPLVKPKPNTLKVDWKMDNVLIAHNKDSVTIDQNTLSTGDHTVIVTVEDTTSKVRVDNHKSLHLNSVSWTVRKTPNGIELNASQNSFEVNVYPNPATDVINLELTSAQGANGSYRILNMLGQEVMASTRLQLNGTLQKVQVPIAGLQAGQYFVELNLGGVLKQLAVVKQ